MGCHLQIVVLTGVFLYALEPARLSVVMPGYIPGLPDVQARHFFKVYPGHLAQALRRVLSAPEEVHHRSEVDEVASVDAYVNSEQQVHAFLVSAHFAVVLDVVDNEGAIVDHLTQRCDVEYGVAMMAEHLRNEHA